jgi:hypothetical protein
LETSFPETRPLTTGTRLRDETVDGLWRSDQEKGLHWTGLPGAVTCVWSAFLPVVSSSGAGEDDVFLQDESRALHEAKRRLAWLGCCLYHLLLHVSRSDGGARTERTTRRWRNICSCLA